MSTSKNKAIVKRFYEINFSGGAEQATRKIQDEYFSHDFIAHVPEGTTNVEDFIKGAGQILDAFSDLKISLNDMVAEGDRVAIRYTISGNHKGVFAGVPATGKKVVFNGFEIRRLSGGKFVEYWGVMDTLGIMQQIGAIPKS